MVIMDPHPLWLSAMMGDTEHPVAVLDSYKTRPFKVIPSLGEISELFHKAGLRIVRVLEPEIDDDYKAIDAKAYHFYKEFPAWWVFELETAE